MSLSRLENDIRLLPWNSQMDVGTWLARRSDRDRAFRGWLWSISSASDTAVLSCGVCVARPQLYAADLVQTLQRIGTQWPDVGQPVERLRIPRETPPGRLFTSLCVLAPPGPGARPVSLSADEGEELARQAAAIAACADLMDQIANLRLSTTQRVEGFLEADPRRRPRLLEALRSAARVEATVAPDGSVDAAAELTLERSASLLAGVARAIQPADVGGLEDLVGVLELNSSTTLRGAGCAPRPILNSDCCSQAAHAGWGLGGEELLAHVAISAPMDAEAAQQLAVIEARAQLVAGLYALPTASGGTVAGLALLRPELHADLALLLDWTVEVEHMQVCEDGTWELWLKVPLYAFATCISRHVEGILSLGS